MPVPAPPPRSAGQSPARFWEPRPRGRPPAPPSVPGPTGAGSKLGAAPAPTLALCSASRLSASAPSSADEHAPDGSSACPHVALHSVTPRVPQWVHLYVVTDLAVSGMYGGLARIRSKVLPSTARKRSPRQNSMFVIPLNHALNSAKRNARGLLSVATTCFAWPAATRACTPDPVQRSKAAFTGFRDTDPTKS